MTPYLYVFRFFDVIGWYPNDRCSVTAAISKIDLPTFGFWCLSVVPTDSQPTFNLHANTNSF
jgi:hypothetical protein